MANETRIREIEDSKRFAKVCGNIGTMMGYVIGVITTFVAMWIGWNWGSYLLGGVLIFLYLKTYS